MQKSSGSAATVFVTDKAPQIDDIPVSMHGTHPHNPLPHKLSRDEMNLAEFPLTVLSKRADPSVKTLEFSDYVKGKNGDLVNRTWIITGADKFGLPTSSDDEVLLGLLKLTADEGLQTRKVHFTRYELLRILRWTTEGRSYTRLQNALDRLSGVRIKATNAFYDNETKLHSTRNFGIIDAYEINDGRDTRPSFFTWSEVLFKSFQVGFIKKLDLDFYLDLESAVSKRLYRYLDKHFWYRSRMQVNLFTLAHEKIGVSRNYVYASSLRQQIEPALEELKQKGILSDYEFAGKGKSTEVVLVAAHAPKKTIAATPETAAGAPTSTNANTAPAKHNEPHVVLPDEVASVKNALVERGLAEKQAIRLTAGQGRATLERMHAIVQHFDSLLATKSLLVSKSPTGFLYRAVERPFEFVLPGEKRVKQGDFSFSSQSAVDEDTSTQRSAAHQPREKVRGPKIDLEVAYLTARSERLERVIKTSSRELTDGLRSEVERALHKLKSHISPQRFQEAVQHGVEQRLLENDGFPDFDEWARQHE
jgi:plasmid replication initiation protein